MAADRDDDTRAAAPDGPGNGSRDAVWRQEMARLDQLRVVAQAQHLVAAAEQTDLTHALAAARQRVVDAQRRLTQAPPTQIRRPSPRRRPVSRMPAGPRRS
jgi:hypothetical protein